MHISDSSEFDSTAVLDKKKNDKNVFQVQSMPIHLMDTADWSKGFDPQGRRVGHPLDRRQFHLEKTRNGPDELPPPCKG